MDSKSGDGEKVVCSFDRVETRPSVAIVETIKRFNHANTEAEARGLQAPLQHAIETDALDTLIQSTPAIELTLSIEEYQITLHENTVAITTHGPP